MPRQLIHKGAAGLAPSPQQGIALSAMLLARELLDSGNAKGAYLLLSKAASRYPTEFASFTSLLSRHEPAQPKGTIERQHLPGSERSRTVLSEELRH